MSNIRSGVPAEQIAASFKQLHTAANYLNKVSDALGQAISNIESVLAKLNLGVEVWTEVEIKTSEAEISQLLEIGYHNGFLIRTWTRGSRGKDWKWQTCKHFNDSPREARLASVPKIPELIDNLRKVVETRAAEIKPVVDQASEFANALLTAAQSESEEVDA